MGRVEDDADLLPSLPNGGDSEIGVVRFETPTGETHLARPGVAASVSPANEQDRIGIRRYHNCDAGQRSVGEFDGRGPALGQAVGQLALEWAQWQPQPPPWQPPPEGGPSLEKSLAGAPPGRAGSESLLSTLAPWQPGHSITVSLRTRSSKS